MASVTAPHFTDAYFGELRFAGQSPHAGLLAFEGQAPLGPAAPRVRLHLGELHTEASHRAFFEALAQRHPALRTEIAARLEADFPDEDLASWNDALLQQPLHERYQPALVDFPAQPEAPGPWHMAYADVEDEIVVFEAWFDGWALVRVTSEFF